MFSLIYDAYGAIFNWGAVVIIGGIMLGLWMIFSKKFQEHEKILAAIVLVIIGITPLGSNNQLYSNINNLFLIIPFVLYALYKVWKAEREVFLKIGKFTLQISTWPLLIMSGVCIVMLCVQSIAFGNTFIFRDSAPRDREVGSIATVEHMKTNAENAQELEELGAYVAEAGLEGRQVLLFGDVPALSAYLKMPFVMSPWPDLPSYSNATFEAELEKVTDNIKNSRPVIILGADFYDFLTNQVEDMDMIASYEADYGFKADLLADMIDDYVYTCTFRNDRYVIYE